MESDSNFAKFIESLFQDAMKNPEKLKDLEEIWDKDWEDLLEGVSDDEDSYTKKSRIGQTMIELKRSHQTRSTV